MRRVGLIVALGALLGMLAGAATAFASVFTGTTKVAGGSIHTSAYGVPGIITLAIISAVFGNPGPASWTPASAHFEVV